jgi:phi13 family phage major tail protein
MSIQEGEKKSVVGLRDLYYALVTQDDADAYAAGAPAPFAPAINVSEAPGVNSKDQYADDGPFDTMSAEGATKIDMEATAIPLPTQAIVLGKVFDAATGRMFDNGGTPPYVALGYRTIKSNGSYLYRWFLKGRFTAPGTEAATKTDTPEPKQAKITYTAIKTIHQFDLGDINDGVKRVVGDDDTTDFDGTDWFTAVQVPVAGAPSAPTCTPSPADGATGVAITVSPTLTFNNPLAGGAENGITLVDETGQAAVALARTLSADRKVVTLNPTASMATSNAYLIVVASVTDVYGQALANVVYNFETAAP